MVKKKNPSAAASSTSGGAAAKPSSILPKEGAPSAPPPLRRRRRHRAQQPSLTFAASEDLHNLPNDASEGRGSSEPVDSPAEETRASPMKRSIGGFADEDDLLDFDDAFIEPPPKRARSDAVSPAAAASEASALKVAPVAQASTASSLSKGKDAPAAAAAPPSDLRGVISSLEAFASQFTSSKLEGAIKKAAVARQEVDSLKEELNRLKERLKEEEARAAEKDELLRQSALALLEAANIPATALDKIPSNSPANGVSTVLTAHQLTRGLLDKGKGALARMHSMIFPKATQEKTLGQLIDAFAVDTKEVIEVFPVPSFVDDSSGVLPESDRIQRMKDRIAQMEKDMRITYALAAIINKKSETAANVERYALTELHKATESLNFPPTLLALMSEFGNAKKVRDLVRAQVFAGAKFTLALVLARYPSAGLLSIANVTGDLEAVSEGIVACKHNCRQTREGFKGT
ncbi:hypothetical protein QYE76_041165 [Lolium multiflorum]|uniref:Uncharacterized protein n=1 Tax=Lolium multiflorum TaxID=4521 RepID=A0AAD8TEF3_LOLMU|nr:hypothetical protein QYE76_041165 [Lolium multiflorum]